MCRGRRHARRALKGEKGADRSGGRRTDCVYCFWFCKVHSKYGFKWTFWYLSMDWVDEPDKVDVKSPPKNKNVFEGLPGRNARIENKRAGWTSTVTVRDTIKNILVKSSWSFSHHVAMLSRFAQLIISAKLGA